MSELCRTYVVSVGGTVQAETGPNRVLVCACGRVNLLPESPESAFTAYLQGFQVFDCPWPFDIPSMNTFRLALLNAW